MMGHRIVTSTEQYGSHRVSIRGVHQFDEHSRPPANMPSFPRHSYAQRINPSDRVQRPAATLKDYAFRTYGERWWHDRSTLAAIASILWRRLQPVGESGYGPPERLDHARTRKPERRCTHFKLKDAGISYGLQQKACFNSAPPPAKSIPPRSARQTLKAQTNARSAMPVTPNQPSGRYRIRQRNRGSD
jgi:hypothetical protein